MIIGVGNDIIQISRIKEAATNKRFLDKYFTSQERHLFEKRSYRAETIAGNFAVKEAVSKVFGTGVTLFELTDIEVLRDGNGKPYVNLYNNAKALSEKLSISNIHVSISHSKDNVVAFAIGEGRHENDSGR